MARWRFRRAAIFVMIASLLLPAGPVAATQDPACSDVQLVWARGTGRVVGSDNEFATINDQLRGRLGALVESSYQLGAMEASAGSRIRRVAEDSACSSTGPCPR